MGLQSIDSWAQHLPYHRKTAGRRGVAGAVCGGGVRGCMRSGRVMTHGCTRTGWAAARGWRLRCVGAEQRVGSSGGTRGSQHCSMQT